MLLSLAVRNLFRNLRRTMITSAAIVFGVALSIFGWGTVEGLDENMLRASRTTATGDVILRPDGYPTDGLDLPLDQSQPVSPELQKALDAVGPWTSRVVFRGRLVKGVDASRVNGIGYDPVGEDRVFPRAEWRLQGRWAEPGKSEMVVGQNLARLLEIAEGDEVVLEARTRAGARNALTYTVRGIVRTDNAALDNLSAWIPMDDANALLALDGERTHLMVLAGNAEGAARALGGKGWTPTPLREEIADLLQLNGLRRRVIALVVFVIMAIAATGIANTIIMSVYERVREIGTLLALGMRQSQIRTLFLLEGAMMGLAAGLLGATIGTVVVSHFERVGIELGETAMNASADMAVSAKLYLKLVPEQVALMVLFGMTVAVLASLWPARHAASLNPADAVKAD